MAVFFFNEDIEAPVLEKNKIKQWIKKVAGNYDKVVGKINIIFCSDEYLLKINKEYLNHDYYTDVITFDYCRSNIISGDIFISLERVNANAKDFKSADSELFRVIIHGVLHLIGFVDHSRSSDKLMRKEEDAALNILFGLS